jgi:hypothetical protein
VLTLDKVFDLHTLLNKDAMQSKFDIEKQQLTPTGKRKSTGKI